MATGTRKTHDFCWINVITDGAEGARAFYARLFGWSYGEMPGVPGGRLIRVGEHTAGALMDLAVVNMPPGTPPTIGVMVKVESADDAVARVASLGGRAEPAFDVLENGRMAMCTDPGGAVFAVWQPKKEGGIDVDSRAHGAPTWFEALSGDPARVAKFYADLFGWTAEEEPMPGMVYTLLKLGAVPVAGAMSAPPAGAGDAGQTGPRWATTFAVTNADVSASLAVELGATQRRPVQAIPGVGRFATLTSPQGVSFGIVEYS